MQGGNAASRKQFQESDRPASIAEAILIAEATGTLIIPDRDAYPDNPLVTQALIKVIGDLAVMEPTERPAKLRLAANNFDAAFNRFEADMAFNRRAARPGEDAFAYRWMISVLDAWALQLKQVREAA